MSLWGDLIPQSNPQMSIEHERNGGRVQVSLSLNFTNGNTFHCKVAWVESDLDDMVITSIRNGLVGFLHDSLVYTFLGVIRSSIYDWDPRIGWKSTWTKYLDMRPLPECPLFDPPKGPIPPVPGQDGEVSMVDPLVTMRLRTLAQKRLVPTLSDICPLCGKAMSGMTRWGGGNLLWVHDDCFLRVFGEGREPTCEVRHELD